MNTMRTSILKYFIAILFLGIFISCNVEQNSNDENDSETIENNENDENTEEQISDLDSLENKMDQIMNESETVEGDTHKDVRVVKAGSAKLVEVKLKIGAGKLKLSSGSSELLTAGFVFTDEVGKPKIEYKTKGENGYLLIKQHDSHNINMNKDDKNAWNLKFSENVPLSFDIEVGAGLSEIYLNNLQIDNFDMTMGVGKTEIDLKGKWRKSAEIHLEGGIGLSVIHLPDDIGILLNVSKGLGAVEVHNLNKKNDSNYENDAYQNAKIKLKVYLKTGIGKIEVD